MAEIGPDDPARGGAERRRRRAAIGLAAILAGLAAWGAVDLLAARSAATDGLDAASAVAGHWDDPDQARAHLEQAAADFDRAAERAGSPPLRFWRLVPGVGTQITSVRALAGAAADGALVGTELVDAVDAAASDGGTADQGRVAAAEQLHAAVGRAHARFEALDAGPDRFLLPPLADARATFVERHREATEGLARADALLGGLTELLRGPSTYLVLATNNAEMRNGMGTPLYVAELHVTDGHTTLTDFEKPPIGVPPAAPFTDADLERNWAWLKPNFDLRMTGLSARFDVNAEQAAAVWKQQRGHDVDGVLSFDVEFIRALLTLSGPVEVEGRTIGADEVVEFLLRDQYALPDGERQAVEEGLGKVAFERLSSELTSLDLAAGSAFAEAVEGRHLLLWSNRPSQQSAWEAAGAAGMLAPNEIGVGIINRGPDKLDPFLAVAADLAVVGRYADRTDVELTLDVTNTATGDEPETVAFGANKELSQSPSEYRGVVAVTVPGEATNLRIAERTSYVVHGVDGPHQLAAVQVFVVPQQTERLVVRFSLPPDAVLPVLAPTGRLPEIESAGGGRGGR
ncbi:MAG: DUF4012 domain-containing protein [Acidimicrobiia bacterium]|nr:DUF4012 domain-containing protein [Acidimicrobiia bacterium]